MKKTMKKMLAMLLAVAMVGVMLFGCGNSGNSGGSDSAGDKGDAAEDGEKTYKVAVLIAGLNAYFEATREGANQAAEEYGLELTFYDGGWDAETQLSQMEDCITLGYDIIALAACDAEGIVPGIEAAKEAGIPVVTFTNAVGSDESGMVDGVVSFVGQNEVTTGKLCAQMAENLLGEEGGKVVCLEGVAGTFCQIYRAKGFEEGIEGTNIEVVYSQVADWSKETAMSIIEDCISSGLEFDLVFCQDDGMAAGAGQALEEAGLKDKVKVIGIGGSKDGFKAMEDGLIDGDTFMSAVEEGHTAIEVCNKYLTGEEVPERTELVQVEVTLDNMGDFEPEW
ncbi:MAG: sugar ABC transporter substrate-binding protein [Hespellia sp.]|jgi:ribose transport system substrate-binding protein|nr:sugar ABC transporter substrate-binding protein [Hespellia sp.]